MIKKIKLLIFIICILSFVNTSIRVIIDKNYCYKKEERVAGVITNIRKTKGKVEFDIKGKEKYRATYYKENFTYKLGDKVLTQGTVFTPNDNTNFNLFNYRKYLLSKKITKQINVNNIELISKNKNIFYSIKNSMLERINKYKSKNYLKAFITGDTSSIKSDVKESYQAIGISHLFAISGMHVSLFIFVLNFILKKHRFKIYIIFAFLFFLLFLTNYTESLMRCVVFLILNQLNKKFKLGFKTYNVLIITAFLLLLINPYLIYSIGFLFSITITFFIIISSKKINNANNYFKKLLFTSLVCFFSSIPILAMFFFKINLLTPIYNIIFIPFVSLIIFPLSLITFILPFFDAILFNLITLLERLSLFFAQIKYLVLIISKPNFIFVIIYYVSLILALKVNYKYFYVFLLILVLNIYSRFFIINPEVIFLDVDQGDCSIILLPKGKTIVIDTGGKIFSNYSIAKKSIIPYLNSRGINKIDSLVLTHGDYDHMGEAINLVNNINVGNVVFNIGEYNDLELELVKTLKSKNISYYQNVDALNIGYERLYFLNTKDYEDENENSNVIYTEINNTKILLMGDAGIKKENDIIEKYDLNNIDVLKVGHHGSDTSSSKEFINSINPKTCLISVGKNNRYGHPKDRVINLLDDYCNIYRMDINGSVEIKLKNKSFKIKRVSS